MACWVCGAAGTWSLNAFHSLLGRTFFVPHSCVVGNPMVSARADLSEPSSLPCLGFALRQFEFLIQMFLLSHSFQFVLHSILFSCVIELCPSCTWFMFSVLSVGSVGKI